MTTVKCSPILRVICSDAMCDDLVTATVLGLSTLFNRWMNEGPETSYSFLLFISHFGLPIGERERTPCDDRRARQKDMKQSSSSSSVIASQVSLFDHSNGTHERLHKNPINLRWNVHNSGAHGLS